jgi:hypothetical protein
MPLSRSKYGRKDKFRTAEVGISPVDTSTGIKKAKPANVEPLIQAVRALGAASTGGSGGTGNTSGTNNLGGGGGTGIGGGPQAGTPASGALGSQGEYSGDPFTGFSARYEPGMAKQLFNNPGLILQDVLRYQGVSDPLGANAGYYNALEPLADIANELLLMQNNVPGGLSPESAINTIASMFNNQSTVGGRAPSFNDLITNMLGADMGSPLGAYLSSGLDPNQQIKNFLNLGQAAGTVGLHPYYADAFNAIMATAANDYLSQMATGQYTGNFEDYFGQNYAGGWGIPGY